jgi:hypothetical protein
MRTICSLQDHDKKKNMVELTSSSSNMHGVVDDNSNSFINIIMNVMRMNQGYVGECPNHR